MIRTFVAVAIPENVQRSLGEQSHLLRSMGLAGSFPKPESIHLTLKFLGDVQESDVYRFGEAIQAAVQGIEPFRLRVEGLGVFPGLSAPRVVWIGVEHHERLHLLQSRVEASFEELGFPREGRAFRPHLTLARLKSRDNLKSLANYLKEEGLAVSAGEMAVDAVHLYRSELHRDGARYTRLRTAELAGAQG
jgi:RNA 2',3'-cyclic 3'-phosphodiesterase